MAGYLWTTFSLEVAKQSSCRDGLCALPAQGAEREFSWFTSANLMGANDGIVMGGINRPIRTTLHRACFGEEAKKVL